MAISLNFKQKELTYQLAVFSILFIFFSYSQEDPEEFYFWALFAPYKFAFFGNYMLAAELINYVLLPKLYYKNKQVLFFLMVCLLISSIILIDEFVLEQIFFPNTRGMYFPGVLFTLIETLPIIMIMVGFKIAWDINRKQREINELKSLMRESELQFLKSQINPHFLFNHLNNLYSYAIENSPKTISIILELSSVLRYMLYDCREDFVPLTKELEHLKNYTALNELQIENRGIVDLDLKVVNSNYVISPLVLIVFIENAFKHSTESQIEDIFIHIKVDVSEGGLLIFECNNSISSEYISRKNSKGIGLDNVSKRLKLLYPESHSLKTDIKDCTYKVHLSMQLNPS